MSVFKTNHQQASMGFEPLPVGFYETTVTKVEITQSSNGNDMLKCELMVRDIPGQEQYKGRKFFNNLVFTEKAYPIVQAFLKAVGIPDGTDFPTYEAVGAAIIYKPVRLKNTHRMYLGEMRDNVSFVEPTKFPMGADESAKYAAIEGSGVINAEQAQGAASAGSAQAAPQTGGMAPNDLPF